MITRCAEVHACPALAYPLDIVAATTFAISASGITINGQMEPSSMVIFFRPATCAMCSPTSLLPVKDTLRTRWSATRASPRVPPEPVKHCTASAGTPASSRISTSFKADKGVSLAGLMITELPAASAGATTLWATRFSGKLNGVMATTTPTGTRNVNPSWPVQLGLASRGMVSP